MKIIAGKFRGRNLVTPDDRNIRPTSQRTRESLFGIITARYGDTLENARVIDLFAGTGALGLEAISRGAEFALFIDQSNEACKIIRKNIENLNLQNQTRLLCADATTLRTVKNEKPFNLIFADPPYNMGITPVALERLVAGNWLAPDALVIVEDNSPLPPSLPPSFNLLDMRKFGDTNIYFLKYHAK